MSKPQIHSLQVFRGLAALAVVAHHAAVSTETFVETMPAFISSLFTYGLLGVDFFFVLSGFIIMYAHMDDERNTAALKRYAFKRMARIYPAYLPVGLGLIALYAALPGLSAAGGRDYSLISSLLLVPADDPPALSVAWTLVHELMFYGVFLLFFISRRWLVAGLVTWALVILWINQWSVPTGWLRYPLSLLNIEFMFGVGAAWLVRSRAFSGCSTAAGLLGSTMVFSALWLMPPEKNMYFRLILTIGLALLIVSFATREQVAFFRWPAYLLSLGNASFSIYLIHNPLLSITQRVAGQLELAWPAAMAWAMALSVLAGWIYYQIIERPALRFFQNRLHRQ